MQSVWDMYNQRKNNHDIKETLGNKLGHGNVLLIQVNAKLKTKYELLMKEIAQKINEVKSLHKAIETQITVKGGIEKVSELESKHKDRIRKSKEKSAKKKKSKNKAKKQEISGADQTAVLGKHAGDAPKNEPKRKKRKKDSSMLDFLSKSKNNNNNNDNKSQN